MKTLTQITHNAYSAALLAVGVVALLFALLAVAEPQITHSQSATEDFTIRQTITDETSFSTTPADVVMDGGINGITGGQATGSTQFVVKTNNAAGYRVDISFEENGTANAMIGDSTGNLALRNYDGDASGQPSRGYTPSTTAALFTYTVTSSTTLDTDDSFLHDGSTCDVALGLDTVSCWKSPAVAAFPIVNRDSSAINGATTTVLFNVTVPSGATPVPEAETYTATATLSVFTL